MYLLRRAEEWFQGMYLPTTLLKNLPQAPDRTGRSGIIGFVTSADGILKLL